MGSVEAIRDTFSAFLQQSKDKEEYKKFFEDDNEPQFFEDPLPETLAPKSLDEQIELAKTVMIGATLANRHTPDLHRLLLARRGVPVFIYGRHRAGFPGANLLAENGAVFVGKGFSMMNKLAMYLPNRREEGRTFTSPKVCVDPKNGHRIYGEMYIIPHSTLMNLDHWHQNGVNCSRIMQTFQIVNDSDPKRYSFETMTAWMYLYRPVYCAAAYKKNILTLAELCTRKKPLPKDTQTMYYAFMKKDYLHEIKANGNRRVEDQWTSR